MRCHPGVAFPLERVVPKGGAVIRGHHIKADTVIGIIPAVIHKDKLIFGIDADKFNPERWLVSDKDCIKYVDRNLMTVNPFIPVFLECH